MIENCVPVEKTAIYKQTLIITAGIPRQRKVSTGYLRKIKAKIMKAQSC
jgi:hypothetical protein